MANLTPKQQLFVEAYLGVARSNATEAARLAGYKGNDNVLGVTGHDLLKNPKIAALVAERLEEAKGCMSADEVLAEISGLARGADRDSDRLTALGLLAKHYKLVTDKVEHSGEPLAKVYLGFDPEKV